MPLTARQLRQLLTIKAISRVLYFADALKKLILKRYNITIIKEALILDKRGLEDRATSGKWGRFSFT